MAFAAPNYTQTPNDLIDKWLPHLGNAELKVLLVIIRKTFGWHKVRDKISLTQLQNITGLERRHVLKGVRGLIEKGLIIKQVEGPKQAQVTFYELVVIDDSNNFTQCLLDTPPSVFRTPTKETLPKETKEDPPISPRGGWVPAAPKKSNSRQKIQEEPVQRTFGVVTTPRQHQQILEKLKGDEEKVTRCYNLLAEWKVKKGIVGGSDVHNINKWVIKAVEREDKQPEKSSPEKINKELAANIEKKYPKHKDIVYGHNYIEFDDGRTVVNIKFTDYGFEDIVRKEMMKRGLKL